MFTHPKRDHRAAQRETNECHRFLAVLASIVALLVILGKPSPVSLCAAHCCRAGVVTLKAPTAASAGDRVSLILLQQR